MSIRDYLVQLASGAALNQVQAEDFFDRIFGGEADEAQIAAGLAMVQLRHPHLDELLGAARSMRRHALTVPTDGISATIIDTCGTGGARKTFNVSTVAAFVIAAAAPGRIAVAKHGNKSRTGRGSAELLARLGVNVTADVTVQTRCLREAGLCFCFAVQHHPAARFAAGVRRSLAFPTLFNLLGPLCNPAGARCQLMGLYAADSIEIMGQALAKLGAQSAAVVHGAGGLDEFSTIGPTNVALVREGVVTLCEMDALEFGMARAMFDDLVVRDLDHAVELADAILAGQKGPAHDMVVMNAAMGVWVAGAAPSIPGAIELCREAIFGGAAKRVLDAVRRLSYEPVV